MSREGRKHKLIHRPDAGESRCGAADSLRCALCRSPAVAGKKAPHAWRSEGLGAPQGNKNALKHEAYTREALERRAQCEFWFERPDNCSKGLGRALGFLLIAASVA